MINQEFEENEIPSASDSQFDDVIEDVVDALAAESEAESVQEDIEEQAEEIVEDLTPEDNDFSSNQIVLSCNPEKDYYYSYHTANIICNFRSINNALNNLEICIKENCETFSIQSNKEKNFEFQIQPSNNPVKVTLKNSEIILNIP